ncbi:MAG TPA: efflux RND transporter periplasmic adaptor subunit, partial [Vicinamibacterales bacterium]|nr:efflux RND transporter periplasmic adaptor subunit [Vicinamibacterales bacterium]
MKRMFVVTTIFGLAAAAMAGGCARGSDGAAAVKDPPTVAVARIRRGDIAQTLGVAAAFRPFQEIEVHAKVAGYLKRINVDVGDRVKAGQLLAVLEVPELEDQAQQDDAEVKRAEEEINRAKADVERAQAAYEAVHLASTRLSGVRTARPTLVAQQDVDEATGRDRVSEAQVATAKASLAAADQQLDVAKAARKKTTTLEAYSQITAPFDGVITHRYADTGAMIQAGTSSQTQAMPVVTLSENSLLRLVIPVPESAVARIHVGSTVSLQVDAIHKTLTGTISRFSDRLDTDTRTMHVEVDVKNRTLELVPGMYANASIVLDEARNVVVAPVDAIDRNEAGGQALVVNAAHQIEAR